MPLSGIVKTARSLNLTDAHGQPPLDGDNVEVHADGTVRMRQGSVEEPSMDPIVSMVDLVTIQRAYSANIEALRAMDGVLASVTGEVGKVGA